MLQKEGRNLFEILHGLYARILSEFRCGYCLKSIQIFLWKRFFIAVMAIRVFWKIFSLFLALGIIFFIFAASFCKVQAADILTKTLNWRLFAAIGILQILITKR